MTAPSPDLLANPPNQDAVAARLEAAFRGEAPPAPAAPAAPPQHALPPRDAPTGQFTTPPSPEPPANPAQPGAPAPPAEAPEGSAGTPPVEDGIRTVAQAAEYFGAQPDQFMQEIHVEGPDGAEIPLSQVFDEWQAAPQARVASEQGFLQERTAMQQQHQQGVAQVNQLLGTLRQQIEQVGPSERDIWQAEQQDPARGAMMRQERNSLAGLFDSAVSSVEQMGTQSQQEAQANAARIKATEDQLLMASWPELSNPTVKATVQGEVAAYLKGVGYNDGEIAELVDHRIYKVVRDAMRGNSIKTDGKERLAEAKQRGLPKPLAPNARGEVTTPAQDRTNNVNAALEAHGKDQGVDSAAAVFGAMGIR